MNENNNWRRRSAVEKQNTSALCGSYGKISAWPETNFEDSQVAAEWREYDGKRGASKFGRQSSTDDTDSDYVRELGCGTCILPSCPF